MTVDSRPTPYALVFDAPPFTEEFFPRIAADERTHGRARDPAGLVALPAGAALLAAVLPEEERGPAAAPGRSPGGASAFVVERYAALLFAAYRFWEAGRPEYRIDEAVVRGLLTAPPVAEEGSLARAPAAGYAVLPRHVVWARIEEGAPAEPVDGMFWVHTPGEPAALVVVAAMGVRADRPGFSVLDAAAPVPAEGHFAAAAEPGEFDNFLPGGELQKLFGVRTSAALLRFASLLLGYMERHPAAITADGGTRRVAWLADG